MKHLEEPRTKAPIQLNATVVEREDITPELFILRILPDAGVPDFVAGQYGTLGLTAEAPRLAGSAPDPKPLPPQRMIRRAYSIASPPSQRQFLEFYLALVSDGALTPRLATLQPGNRVFWGPKVTGHFTLEAVPEDAHLALISTGTGLAPYLSMLGEGSPFASGRRILIAHGVRFPEDLAYRSLLAGWQNQFPNQFEYLPFVSRADPPAGGKRGHVTRIFDDPACEVHPHTHHVFLCGNPAMIDELEATLTQRGFSVHSTHQPGNLHFEKYW